MYWYGLREFDANQTVFNINTQNKSPVFHNQSQKAMGQSGLAFGINSVGQVLKNKKSIKPQESKRNITLDFKYKLAGRGLAFNGVN